jgi:hypothetical protein
MPTDRVIRIEALDRDGALLEGAQFRVFIDSNPLAESQGGRGFITMQLQHTGAQIRAEASYGKYHHEVIIAESAETIPIVFPEVKYVPVDQRFENIVFFVGVAFLLIGLALAIVIPTPTIFQTRIFSGFFALAAGAFGLKLTGMLNVQMSFGQRLVVSATGAFAVFILVYFFMPAH